MNITWAAADQIDWFELQQVGRRGLSPTRTVTEHDVLAFAGLTGDMAELHTSEAFARQAEFGGRIAHGMLNLALAHGLVVRSGRLVTSGIALLGWAECAFARRSGWAIRCRRSGKPSACAKARPIRRRGSSPTRSRCGGSTERWC